MKKIRVLLYFFIPSFFYFQFCQGQDIFYCETPSTQFEELSLDDDPCKLSELTQSEIDELPIITIYVNFHFIDSPDFPSYFFPGAPNNPALANGNHSIPLLMAGIENILTDLQPSTSGTPNFLGDSKIRVKIYTEENNSNDLYGGIWYWNSLADYDNAYDNGLLDYQDRVIHIEIKDKDGPNVTNWYGSACAIGGDCNTINLWDWYQLLVENSPSKWAARQSGPVLHEILHILGLQHSFYCNNQCQNIDIDPFIECGNTGNCCNLSPGASCSSQNPVPCNGTWGGAVTTNIMANTHAQQSLSPCQWAIVYGYLIDDLHPAADFCDIIVDEEPLIIPSGTDEVWSSLKIVKNQKVIIENGASLTITCEVRMPPNGEIIVERNADLTISGGKVRDLCGERWEGITVHGQSSAHQYEIGGYRNQGYVLINNGSIIEKATFGVRLFDPNNKNTTGGIVIANEAIFRNNWTSIVFAPYQNYHFFNGQPTGNLSSFRDCQFILNDEFSGEYPNEQFAHVQLRKVTGIEFYGCEFTNSYNIEGKPVVARGRGILSRDSDFLVSSTCIDDGIQTFPCEPDNVKRSYFEGFNHAIEAYDITTINTFRVIESDFYQNAIGISVHKIDNVYLVDNNFSVGHPSPTTGNAFAGIRLILSTGYKVEENHFVSIPFGNSNVPKIGSLVISSGEEANEIYKNYYNGLDFGNLANGKNRNESLTTPKGLQYLCNINNETATIQGQNSFDFAVDEEASIAFNQGNSNVSTKNCFSENAQIDDSDFLNNGPSINYFHDFTCNPQDVSSNVSKIPSNENQCVSKFPENKEGKLSEDEKQNFEQAISQNIEESQKDYAVNMLIREAIINEEFYDLNTARYFISEKTSLHSKFSIVDSWLQENEVTNAQQSLNEITTENIETQIELSYFKQLKNLQIQGIEMGLSDEKLLEQFENDILSIAEAGEYYASIQAQGLVNSIKGYTYDPIIKLPDNNYAPQEFNTTNGNIDTNGSNEFYFLSVNPNPAFQEVSFSYQLPEDINEGKIIILSIEGKIIHSLPLNQNKGDATLNVDEFQKGIYFYQLQSQERIIATKKLIISN